MVEVVVEYDYAAQEPDELTIKKGDIITDVVKRPGGWWEGVLRDRKGMFPDNFVRPLDKDPSSVTLRNKKDVSRIRQCRAVFSYSPLHEDELKLNVGDVINVVGEEEEGWWRGLLNGNEGVFPSNFVEEIVQSPPKPSSREEALSLAGENEPISPPKLPSKPTKQLCEVKFPYKAQNEDELTLKEGDIITIINKESQDPGWWKGELNGHIGVFPDNFVTIISSGDDKSISRDDKKVSKLNTDTGAIKSTSVASQRKSLEVKTEPKSDRPPSSDPISIKTTPPLPGKKPLISIKKSPSSSGSGLFSEIKKKLVDVVDGATGSKISPSKTEGMEVVKDNSIEAFDQVERRPLLTDVRATRAKAPGRRLPNLHKDDDVQPNIPNGNVDHLADASEPPSASQSNVVPDSDSEKPRLREWEKHKAPWLEEMKLNQAKRTSTSPGPSPEGRNKLTPTGEKGEEKEEKGSPVIEKEREIDMSKSLPPLDLSKSLSVNNKVKTPLNELEKAPSIKTKPALPAFRQSLSGSLGKENSQTSNYRHSTTPLGVLKDPTPTKPAAPAPPKISPNAAQFSMPLSSNKINSITTHDSSTVHSQEKEHAGGEPSETITFKHYTELLEKIQKLEAMVQKQNYAIEDLRNKLQVETDMRMLLQEKVMQNVQV